MRTVVCYYIFIAWILKFWMPNYYNNISLILIFLEWHEFQLPEARAPFFVFFLLSLKITFFVAFLLPVTTKKVNTQLTPSNTTFQMSQCKTCPIKIQFQNFHQCKHLPICSIYSMLEKLSQRCHTTLWFFVLI